ncbi:unnamed protein product, partial [Pylaiella littoralis]
MEVNKQKGERGMEESSKSEEANSDGEGDAVEDATDEARGERTAPKGQRAHRKSHEDHRSHYPPEDCLSELPTPIGTVAQVLVETPTNEEEEERNATAAAPQKRDCADVTRIGDKHENTQESLSSVDPTGPDAQVTTVVGVTVDVAKPLDGTVPHIATSRKGSTVRQTGREIQAAAGYRRRSSYLPGQAVGRARSSRGASVQLALPFFSEEGWPSACNPSSVDEANASQAGADVQAQASDHTEEDQQWEDYHALNPRRQHSTPNFVSVRSQFGGKRISVELFESGDSDDSSTSSTSSSGEDRGAKKLEAEKAKLAEGPLSWQQSEEGKKRMAQLTKATVRVETPANKLSRKYLKLFAPSNSAHETYRVLATMHRRMNGT